MLTKDKNNPSHSPVVKIGVTGGIGAGKSVVCRVFAALGIPVYDADTQAKRLLTEDPALVRQLKAHFGEASYAADGTLNRVYLANEVFKDEEKLVLLNSLVHPRVAVDFNKWLQRHEEAPYVIKEAALIFEAGSYKNLNAVVAVSAPEELRVRRTIIRDEHRNRQQVEEIIRKQLSEEERLSRADYKITNGDKSLVVPQVLRLHKQFSQPSFAAR
ncbi:dephospho-CoA kinase [Nafulsella turpanensis]|uniref:dephospho-CoA kinase n=1 Tax=Nafulsella turpanensis TaxID=1265690 RepID=UPI00034D0334|nr:dephospho-CoA kinase [Nafulsella turpanensis]